MGERERERERERVVVVVVVRGFIPFLAIQDTTHHTKSTINYIP